MAARITQNLRLEIERGGTKTVVAEASSWERRDWRDLRISFSRNGQSSEQDRDQRSK